jgi:CheY-like chemotaxis protein
LLVDDEPLVRSMGERLLRSLGYDVAVAHDGVQAVEIFSARHAQLAAVLCDVIMPERSGGDAVDDMKRIDGAVPIIVCSGFPRDEQLSRGGEPLPFLAKPYHRGELATMLHELARRL